MIRTSLLAHLALAIFITAAVTALPAPIQDKTLVAWVYPSNLTQQGGSVLTLIDKAEHFDAIVFGEVARSKWMAGSDFFRRTHQDQASWPLETAGSNTLIHLAITYHSDRVTLFRNGKEFAAYSMGQQQSFGDDAMVLLGLRYLSANDETGFFTGAIEEARIYDQALSAEQLAALKANQSSDPRPLAWWTFEDGKAEDSMETFPTSRLEGNARIADGKLILDGSSYLRAAKDAKLLTTEIVEDSFDDSVQTVFYKPRSKRTGKMWDTWLYFHDGTYYLYYLAGSSGKDWDFNNISMARSSDGVHWKEIGRVLSKGRGVTWMGTGSSWKSPHFEKDGKFFMNFSEWKGPRQTIFFAESKDLIHWTRLGNEYEFVQDERWYEKNGRWDCIWTMARPGGGLLGYWTANARAGSEFGFGESLDGLHWDALPPPQVVGAGIEGGRRHGEVGAVEKTGAKYYMLFGHYPFMVTLIADQPTGPFHRAKKNCKVLAGNTYFARFLTTPQGVLVNHHSMGPEWPGVFGQVYFAPLKRAVVDGEDTLRLGWWDGNEKLKHEIIEVKWPEAAQAASPVVMLASTFNPQEGAILEGTLKLPASKEASAAGLFLAQRDGSGTAILVRAGGITELGPMRADGSGFKAGQRVDREWKFGATARFRLLLKDSLIEFYLDDLLMQCSSLPQMATGKIGLIQGGQDGAIGNLKAWRCLEAEVSAAVGGPTSPRPEGQAQLQIEYPQKHSIFQRTDNTGEIVIEGVLSGPPGPIEARFNGGPWARISERTEPGKFTAALKGEMGQGTLEVRLQQSPKVTVSVPLVSIGDIFVVAGQSNAAGWANHAYEPLADLPCELSLYKRNVSTAWEKLRHPASASGHGSPWPITMSHLCKNQEVPIGLISTAIGGAWLKQWLKASGEHYPGMMATVRAATRGTMKVRALLWFQGEADCNPSQEYAHLSYNGDHDQYLAALKQFVSDVHRDVKLDTVYVGSIGNVPHAIAASAISTRENICQIRRALQNSWQDRLISPGPVVYDVPLASDTIHIHFNSPEEMIPLAKRWAAAISARTYKIGTGRGPILQKAEPGRDDRTVVLTFDQELKISDFKGRPGTKAGGLSCQQDGAALDDADIVSTTVEKNTVSIRFNIAVTRTLRLSYGIDNDGAGKAILRGATDLPVEPFYAVPLTIK